MPGFDEEEAFALSLRSGQRPDEEDEEAAFAASLRAPQPQPAAAANGVQIVRPNGRVETLSESDADVAIATGARLAADVAEERRKAALEAEYGGATGAAIAGALGAGRGLSLGTSDFAGAALTGALTADGPQLTPEARERIAALNKTRAPEQQIALPEEKSGFRTGYEAAREVQKGYQEANSTASLLGEVGGSLLGGGAGLLAKGGGAGARMLAATPAGLATRAAMGTTEAISARLGGGVFGRIGATALGGAVEGGIAGAAAGLADAVPEFAVDPGEAAEHLMASAGTGALIGMSLAGGLAGTGAAAGFVGRKAVEGADALMQRVMPSADTLRSWAGESAYKAAVGRTSKASMKLADRHGGADAVGKTLLDEGIPLAGSAEQILEVTSKRADEIGAELGAKVKEIDALGGVPISRSEVMNRIDEDVLAPLRGNVFAQDILANVENKLASFRGVMSKADRPVIARGADGAERALTRDTISFEELHAMRRDLDQTLRYESAGPPTPAVQILRDVRNVMEDAWLEGADRSAQSVGVEGFAESMKTLKRKYAHLRLAADQAEEAVQTQLANRSISPSDYLTGIGTASAAGGPVGMAMGLATSVGHKFVRERGRGIAALALNQMADLAERKTSLVALTNSGQARIADTANRLVTAARGATYAAEGAAISRFSQNDVADAIAEARDLEDPNSDTAKHLADTARQLDMVNPGMGQAYAQAAIRRGQMVNSMLPTKPLSGAVFSPDRQLDPTSQRKVSRAIEASHEPQKALDRIAAGNHSPEDLRAVKTVYPAMWKRFQTSVLEQFKAMRTPPSLQTRLRVSYATGLNLDPSVMDVPHLQQIAQRGNQEQPKPAEKVNESAAATAKQYKPTVDVDQTFAPRADQLLDQR